MKIKILLNFHGKYSKKIFVKLIYLISRVFWSGLFLIFLAYCECKEDENRFLGMFEIDKYGIWPFLKSPKKKFS